MEKVIAASFLIVCEYSAATPLVMTADTDGEARGKLTEVCNSGTIRRGTVYRYNPYATMAGTYTELYSLSPEHVGQ